MNPLIGNPIQGGLLWNYVRTNNNNGLTGCISYLYICVHICNNNNQRKEAIDLRWGGQDGLEGGGMGGTGGRKGQEVGDVIIF